MAKPILLTVDDDADVVRGIERDLRSHMAPNTVCWRAILPRGRWIF
jgi:hypothetical protein